MKETEPKQSEKKFGEQITSAEQIMAGLYRIPRTGWVRRGVKDPESVGEHTDALIALAEKVCGKLPNIDKEKLLRMLRVHDWPEYIVGDQVAIHESLEEQKKLQKQKYASEHEAMQRIAASLGIEGEEAKELWLEYTNSSTPEAILAHQLDKLQAIKKAAEYQQQGEPVAYKEFADHYRGIITDPILIEILEAIEK